MTTPPPACQIEFHIGSDPDKPVTIRIIDVPSRTRFTEVTIPWVAFHQAFAGRAGTIGTYTLPPAPEKLGRRLEVSTVIVPLNREPSELWSRDARRGESKPTDELVEYVSAWVAENVPVPDGEAPWEVQFESFNSHRVTRSPQSAYAFHVRRWVPNVAPCDRKPYDDETGPCPECGWPTYAHPEAPPS